MEAVQNASHWGTTGRQEQDGDREGKRCGPRGGGVLGRRSLGQDEVGRGRGSVLKHRSEPRCLVEGSNTYNVRSRSVSVYA